MALPEIPCFGCNDRPCESVYNDDGECWQSPDAYINDIRFKYWSYQQLQKFYSKLEAYFKMNPGTQNKDAGTP